MAFYKNTASQIVQCQVTTVADGTPFTGSVTVSVTGDGGTRATGSVGSGAATHEGGGLYSYAPAQAETNYETVSFQFAGTGAITAAVHKDTLPGALMVAADVQEACEDAIVAQKVLVADKLYTVDSEHVSTANVIYTEE